MFHAIDDFENAFSSQRAGSLKILSALTDESLSQEVAPGYRSLGRIAWHLVDTFADMGNRCGLGIDKVDWDNLPETAGEIRDAYEKLSGQLLAAVKEQWTDADMEKEDDLYGEMWKRGVTLSILIIHDVYHVGQITVLMRQAGLQVPGIFGPSKEEWAKMGMEAMK
jgi:uncharacterized damage-inducible protein DinB